MVAVRDRAALEQALEGRGRGRDVHQGRRDLNDVEAVDEPAHELLGAPAIDRDLAHVVLGGESFDPLAHVLERHHRSRDRVDQALGDPLAVRSTVRRLRLRPESEWTVAEVPELRIVSEEAWTAAHARLAASRAVYLQTTGGRTYGRPVNGVVSPYLLTGLGSCGACGSSMFLHRHGQPRRSYYGCVLYHQRGRTVCGNNLEVPMESADEAVLTAVEHDVLNVAVLETSLYKALATLEASA